MWRHPEHLAPTNSLQSLENQPDPKQPSSIIGHTSMQSPIWLNMRDHPLLGLQPFFQQEGQHNLHDWLQGGIHICNLNQHWLRILDFVKQHNVTKNMLGAFCVGKSWFLCAEWWSESHCEGNFGLIVTVSWISIGGKDIEQDDKCTCRGGVGVNYRSCSGLLIQVGLIVEADCNCYDLAKLYQPVIGLPVHVTTKNLFSLSRQASTTCSSLCNLTK